jgi:c-di-GMP-binding flagellar brake protein YcgR
VVKTGRAEDVEGPSEHKERRRYPRIVINLPIEYQDTSDSSLREAMVVNAGAGGFLIESTRDMPAGTKLKVTLLFSKGFELANFEAVTQIVRKEPHRKENSNGNLVWERYLYGLEFLKVSEEDRWKLNWLLSGQAEFEEIFSSLICQL